MTAEHQPFAAPVQGADAGPPPSPSASPSSTDAPDPITDPRALQILSTEHWSLLTSRSLAYNEAFSRAGMFLSFLSASLIVIGFLIAADALSQAVLPVVALLLGVDLFLGVTTAGRLADASREEFAALRGMSRIRHAYTEMVPGIEKYFVSPIHDDAAGMLASFGNPERDSVASNIFHGLTTAIGMLVTIDCVLFASLVTVLAAAIGLATGQAIGAGLVAFLLAYGISTRLGMRMAMQVVEGPTPMFPSRPPD